MKGVMLNHLDYWVEFGIFVIVLLAFDLLVFNKKSHEVKLKEALLWSAFWIGLGLAFGGVIYYIDGHELMLQYYASYFVEKSLSMDNLFVFLMIFTYFKVPPEHQHRTLFWGIIGALVMRFVFIFLGVTLITKFSWMFYIFGAALIYSAVKMITEKDKEIHPENNPIVKYARKIMPISADFDGGKFITKIDGKKFATPLFLVLLMIESSDLIFAIDSIPAVLAISKDTFVVYTSNIMAILGLRALYFAISSIMKYFKFLNYGLAFILAFVGVKMLVADFVHIPILLSLGVIALSLIVSICASLLIKDKPEATI
jgi:tellurite resistance protein TerC